MQKIFIDSRYTNWYFSLVHADKVRVGYTEKHHIIPRFAGGDDSEENLVSLTPREHFIAHWLLTKICISAEHNRSAWNAFFLMHFPRKIRKYTARTYEMAKEQMAFHKSQLTGSLNHFYGKQHTSTTKNKMSDNWNREVKRNFDYTTYRFIHKDGQVFDGTQYAFYTYYKLCKKGVNAMIKGKNKTHKGWSIDGGKIE